MIHRLALHSLLSFALALSVTGSASAEKTGNGGETKYSRQFLFVAKNLHQALPRYGLEAVFKDAKLPFSIRPTSSDLQAKDGTQVDAVSYIEVAKNGQKVRVTRIQTQRWDSKVSGGDCKGLYYITLHELLVHQGREVSTNYRITDQTIDDLERGRKITCNGLPKDDPGYNGVALQALYHRVDVVADGFIQGNVNFAETMNCRLDALGRGNCIGVLDTYAEDGENAYFSIEFTNGLSADCRRKAELMLTLESGFLLMMQIPDVPVRTRSEDWIRADASRAWCTLAKVSKKEKSSP